MGASCRRNKAGTVTAVGCLVRGTAVRGGKKDKYVLARPRKGPVASVPEATCTADPGADALTLDNPEKAGINDAVLGRWVEIGGRLERETSKDPDDLRELDVASFKVVPVVVLHDRRPRPRHRRPPPAAEPPPPAPPAAAADACTCTATRRAPKLPKTASPLPAIGLAGLLSLAAGLMLRSFRLRQRG